MEDNQEKHKKGPNLHKHLPQMHPQDTVTRNHQQRRTLAAKIARAHRNRNNNKTMWLDWARTLAVHRRYIVDKAELNYYKIFTKIFMLIRHSLVCRHSRLSIFKRSVS